MVVKDSKVNLHDTALKPLVRTQSNLTRLNRINGYKALIIPTFKANLFKITRAETNMDPINSEKCPDIVGKAVRGINTISRNHRDW